MPMLHHQPHHQLIRHTLKVLSFKVLRHATYSPDLSPFDYHLFTSIGHTVAEQRFGSYEDVEKWLDE